MNFKNLLQIRSYFCIGMTLILLSGCASYHMRQGNRLYNLMAYKEAVNEYSKALDSPHKSDAQRQLANSYLKLNNVIKARQYFAEVMKDTAKPATAAERQQYADLLMRSGQYNEAKDVLQKTTALDAHGKVMLSSIDSLPDWQKDSADYRIERSNLNSGGESNFSPTYYKDGVLFVSDRGKLTSRNCYEWTGRPFLDLYFAKSDNAGKSGSPEKVSGDMNGKYHEGPAVVNGQGDTMYITRNNYVKKKVGKSTQDVVNLKIYQLYKKDTTWTGMKELPFNSNDFSTGHPALSADGNTMYFASDRPGGAGGSDLYVSKKVNGVWSDPKNLGAPINTAGNEVFPYVWKDSSLYFSSDGGYGMGGLDVFKSDLTSGQPGTPVNMGYPFNTSYDDFGVAVAANGKEGFISSNRETSNTEIDQVYKFYYEELKFTLQGVTVNKATQEPVEGVVVELKNETSGTIEKATSGKDGSFTFKLNSHSDYTVTGHKDEYFTNSEAVTTVGKVKSENMYVKLKLEMEEIVINKPIVLENIYYDFDKWNIRNDAKPGLDKLVQIMKDNPAITIELGSHTDSRADDRYNDRLSQKRAESAVKYIVSNGISRDRISAKGYGETQLVNRCKNGVKCSEAEHQANRRTEFKVVKIDSK
jgi:peptidoglycan-associated lipoprotein